MSVFKSFYKITAFVLVITFLTSSVTIPNAAAGQMLVPLMPAPGTMVNLSSAFIPAYLQGITIHPNDPLKFDFLINEGAQQLTDKEKHQEYTKLVKYFLASLTVPDKDQWVNLSPYEKNRIIENNLGKTEMGRDLLAQDYLLKQITSSLMYPESGLGKNFWDKVYSKAWEQYHTTSIPVNTFNKVWIVPDDIVVYENGNTAYIIKSHLKVMLDEDYLSLKKHSAVTTHAVASKVIREIILPALEKEVNEGKNFALLRQIMSGVALATWYKRALKESLLGKIYADKAKVQGTGQISGQTNEIIYQQYLAAFKKGVYNYIKDDENTYTHQIVPRKYFSGGVKVDPRAVRISDDLAQIARDPSVISGIHDRVTVALAPNAAMTIPVADFPSHETPEIFPAQRRTPLPLFIDVSDDMKTLTYYEVLNDEGVFGADGRVHYDLLQESNGRLKKLATFPSSYLLSPEKWMRAHLKGTTEGKIIDKIWPLNKRYTRYRGLVISWDEQIDKRVWTTNIDTVFFHDRILEAGVLSTPKEKIKKITEIGVGGGHIASLMAQTFPDAQLSITDISPYALQATLLNIEANNPNGPAGLEHVRKYWGKGLHALEDDQDLIIVNPPYIPMPPSADQSAKDPYRGTGLIREIIADGYKKLNPNNPEASIYINVSSLGDRDLHEYFRQFGAAIDMVPIGAPLRVPLKINSITEPWKQWLLKNGGLEYAANAASDQEQYWHTLQMYRIRRKTAFGDHEKNPNPIYARSGQLFKEQKPLVLLADVHGTLLVSHWKKEYALAYQRLTTELRGESSEQRFYDGLHWVEENIVKQMIRKSRDVPFVEIVAMLKATLHSKGIEKSEDEIRQAIDQGRQFYWDPAKAEAVPGAIALFTEARRLGIPIKIISGTRDSKLVYQQLAFAGFAHLINENDIYARDRQELIPSTAQDQTARQNTIKYIQLQFSKNALLLMDDWDSSASVVKRLNGTFVALPQGPFQSQEWRRNSDHLHLKGADMEITNEAGFEKLISAIKHHYARMNLSGRGGLEIEDSRTALPLIGEDEGVLRDAFSSAAHLYKFVSAATASSEDEARKQLEQNLPMVLYYLNANPEGLNFDLQRSEGDNRSHEILFDHVVQRGLGKKILGLEENNINVFQPQPYLSPEAFESAVAQYREIKDSDLLPYFLLAFLGHDIAKSQQASLISQWRNQGIDLLIPNRASASILEHGRLLEQLRVMLQGKQHASLISQLFYQIIAMRGFAGQYVRGEVPYDVFEPFTYWVRDNFNQLKIALRIKSDEELARRVTDIAFLFDFVDVAAVRDSLMTDELNAQLKDVYAQLNQTITPTNGQFLTNWPQIFRKSWNNLATLEDKRNYLLDRLTRFRKANIQQGESIDKLKQAVGLLSEKQINAFLGGFRNFHGWYAEDATSGLTPDSQLKLIALSIMLAKYRGVDISKPFHINFLALMKQLSTAKQSFDYYKLRIVEAFLRQLSWDEVLFDEQKIENLFADDPDNRHAMNPLLDIQMKIDGEKAISFSFNLNEEANALLVLLRNSEKRDSTKFHILLKMLCDTYGLRKDEFDRISNESQYLISMASSRNDKERLVSYVKGPVVVDVGPAGGAVLDILDKSKETLSVSNIVGIDISEEALKDLEEKLKKEGWTNVKLIKGDAYHLRDVMNENGLSSVNTIIFSSILHEIYSYVEDKDGRQFNLETVKDLLKEALRTLPAKGRLLIRDGVIPADGEKEQVMEVYGKENNEFFDAYIANFKGRHIQYQLISEDKINQKWRYKILRADAMEFLYTLTWGPASFPYEVREQYGWATRQGAVDMLKKLAHELGITIREIPLPADQQSYLQPGYEENLKGKAALFDEDGQEARLPDSNMMIAMEVVTKGDQAQLGGIDVASDKALKVLNNAAPIKFNIDPAQLQQLQEAQGFTPIIIDIQPVTDLTRILGLKNAP